MQNPNHNVRMNKVVSYLERNLEDNIDIKYLSSLSCYSEFHFHRVFRACVGESVYSYKKRLLLEHSIKLLLYSEYSITEIAYKTGYQNQSSFNKAFKQQFQVTPSHVRQQGIQQKQTIIKLNPIRKVAMTPEIRTIQPIELICARASGSYAEAAPKAWETIMKFAYSNRLMSKETRSIGISHDDPSITLPDHIRYDACLDIKADVSSHQSITTCEIPGGKYAIFLHKGSYQDFQHSYHFIFNQWLPESGEKLRDQQACFEHYLNRDPRKTKPENLRTEIFIPLE